MLRGLLEVVRDGVHASIRVHPGQLHVLFPAKLCPRTLGMLAHSHTYQQTLCILAFCPTAQVLFVQGFCSAAIHMMLAAVDLLVHCIEQAACAGTSMLIEDVACPVEKLGDMTLDLIDMFERYGYKDASCFGHALEGNLHLVFSQVVSNAASGLLNGA